MTRETAQRASELENQIADAEDSIRLVNKPNAKIGITVEVDDYDPETDEGENEYKRLGNVLSTEARVEIASIITRDLGTQKSLAEAELLKL